MGGNWVPDRKVSEQPARIFACHKNGEVNYASRGGFCLNSFDTSTKLTTGRLRTGNRGRKKEDERQKTESGRQKKSAARNHLVPL